MALNLYLDPQIRVVKRLKNTSLATISVVLSADPGNTNTIRRRISYARSVSDSPFFRQNIFSCSPYNSA